MITYLFIVLFFNKNDYFASVKALYLYFSICILYKYLNWQ